MFVAATLTLLALTAGPHIDNPYWPMKPGTQWIYRETDAQGNRQRVVVRVTHRTKLVAAGIRGRIVRDTVSEHGQLVEDTFDSSTAPVTTARSWFTNMCSRDNLSRRTQRTTSSGSSQRG